MNEQEQFWASEFGNRYTERNRVRWHDRASFWAEIMDATKALSVLEIGCNAGWNLMAIRHCEHDHRFPRYMLEGCDVNEEAIGQAQSNVAGGCILKMTAREAGNFYSSAPRDLVFTAGVLIHVAPDDLEETMRAIAACSKRYVLAIEYASEHEEEIAYHGHANKLWKRPFGKLYEVIGLKLVSQPFYASGFDRCTAWLLEKEGA